MSLLIATWTGAIATAVLAIGAGFTDIGAVLERLGYSIVEATVTEVASSLAEGSVLGLLGGASAGSATRNGVIALVGAVAGLIAGGVAGSQVQRVVATYRVTPSLTGWQLTRVQPETGGAFRPQAA
jgi:hypothetical protein